MPTEKWINKGDNIGKYELASDGLSVCQCGKDADASDGPLSSTDEICPRWPLNKTRGRQITKQATELQIHLAWLFKG